MISPFNVLQAALFGLIFVPIVMFVFVVGMQTWDRGIRFKEDVPIRQKVSYFIRHHPKYLYQSTDWKTTAKVTAGATIIFSALCILGTLMVAGIQAVYL